ncbi:hypothetical protein GGF50DRAFT_131271 [Schizophyllum commune]
MGDSCACFDLIAGVETDTEIDRSKRQLDVVIQATPAFVLIGSFRFFRPMDIKFRDDALYALHVRVRPLLLSSYIHLITSQGCGYERERTCCRCRLFVCHQAYNGAADWGRGLGIGKLPFLPTILDSHQLRRRLSDRSLT